MDKISKQQRSALMSRVKSKGNLSTEMAVEAILVEEKIQGWSKHPKNILGKPDFIFIDEKLILFVDGCFWHGCQRCLRNTPKTKTDYWLKKITDNIKRDNKIRKKLRNEGYSVYRVWEHGVKNRNWVKRLRKRLRIA